MAIFQSDNGFDRITGLPIMSAIPVQIRRISEEELQTG
mgnify:CR=1 FL=1